jgi:hypothetical protein
VIVLLQSSLAVHEGVELAETRRKSAVGVMREHVRKGLGKDTMWSEGWEGRVAYTHDH